MADILTLENLSFTYPCGRKVLKNLSLNMQEKEFLAILGNNGTGKSTLLKCLNRMLRASSGKINYRSSRLDKMKRLDIAKKIALLPQDLPSIKMTVFDTIMLGRKPHMLIGSGKHDRQIVHGAMDKMEIAPSMSGRYLNELSGGERQKVMIAKALAQEPDLLLLDEPTGNLDIKNSYKVMKMVNEICRNDGISVVMVIHDINLALRFCSSILLLKDGTSAGSFSAADIQKDDLARCFDIELDLLSIKDKPYIIVKE